jgi:alanyl-tRNA synthetase
VAELAARLKASEKELAELRLFKATQQAKAIVREKGKTLGGFSVIAASLGVADKDSQQAFVEAAAAELQNGAGVFTAIDGDSLSIFALVGKAAQSKLKAGDLIKELAPIADARGGGRPDRAQAGSKAVGKEAAVLTAAEALLAKVFG